MTKFCASCGASLLEDAKFCNACGQALVLTPLAEQPEPIKPSTNINNPPTKRPQTMLGTVIGMIMLFGGGMLFEAARNTLYIIRDLVPYLRLAVILISIVIAFVGCLIVMRNHKNAKDGGQSHG